MALRMKDRVWAMTAAVVGRVRIGGDVQGRARGGHRLRQARRGRQPRDRLPAVLHRVVVRCRDARQEDVREVPAQGFDRRVLGRPAGRGDRQRDAGRQTAHRLRWRHAEHRLDDQAAGRRRAHRRDARHRLRRVQRLPREERRAEVREREGRHQVARRQARRGAARQLRGSLRPVSLQEGRHQAGRIPEPEHRGHHERLPGWQDRCGGDLGTDRLAPRAGRPGQAHRLGRIGRRRTTARS